MICNKAIFHTEDAAKRALKEINKRDRRKKKPKRVYHCSKCGYYHLTSKSVSEYKRGVAAVKKKKTICEKNPPTQTQIADRIKELQKKIN